MKKCLYCGHDALTELNLFLSVNKNSETAERLAADYFLTEKIRSKEISALSYPDDHYYCRHCGVIITQSDLDRDDGRLCQDALTPDSAADECGTEEEILETAGRLIHKLSWEEAGRVLWSCGYPWQHPVEFLVLRNICSRMILLGTNYAQVDDAQCDQLNVLAHNLRCLSFYLRDRDSAEVCRTMRRLFAAVQQCTDIGALPLNNGSVYALQMNIYTNCLLAVERFQLQLLSNLAQSIRDLRRSEPECLQLELDIRRQYLEAVNSYCKAKKRLLIHPREYDRTNARIGELNEAIAKLNPLFQPVRPVRSPKYLSQSFRACFLVIVLGSLFLLFHWLREDVELCFFMWIIIYLPSMIWLESVPHGYVPLEFNKGFRLS